MSTASRDRTRWAHRAATRVVASIAVAAATFAGLPAAATAETTYSDIASGPHKDNIDALAELGLFTGTDCGTGKFCPGEPAKRWTMAVWMVRTVDGSDPPPPSPPESRFADVDDDEWWMPHVERLADLGITLGCKQEPLRYCPDQPVTRAQMASFLVRAFDLANVPSAGFTDTNNDTHEANIDALFAAGLTVGCAQDPLRYCPGQPVTRAHLATMLRRGLNTRAEPWPLKIGEGPRSGDTLLAASRGRACAVRLDARVVCWGGDEGFLENLSGSGLDNVATLSTGQDPVIGLHTCAAHRDGTVSCWGPGLEGQLGQGNTDSHYLPVTVPGITDAAAVAVGSGFSCVAHRDGTVSCWGRSWYGALGPRVGDPYHSWPRQVPGVSEVVAISAGQEHVCAVHRDGTVSCWGWAYGETPTQISGVRNVLSVSSGGTQTCVTTTSGRVYCWNLAHTLVARPEQIGGITDAVEASVGDGTVCVLYRDGGVSCWGRNDVGQIGDGTTNDRSQPVRLTTITDAVDVSVSSGGTGVGPHACVMHRDSLVSCWGGNEVGQLGDGSRLDGLTPGRVIELSQAPARPVPASPTELLLRWIETVVQNRQREFPWLRVAWDHIRYDTQFAQSGFGGWVNVYCYAGHAGAADKAFGCGAENMSISEISLGVIHELLHVYDLHTGLALPEAWGAVQLYFASTYPDCFGGADHHGSEILADTVLHVMVPHAWLTYYNSADCATLPEGSEPTPEAERVVLQGVAGQVPDWYRDNINNGAELWSAWLRGPSLSALANLKDEFGGLCSTEWITQPLDPARFPPAGSNPFSDGGCDDG